MTIININSYVNKVGKIDNKGLKSKNEAVDLHSYINKLNSSIKTEYPKPKDEAVYLHSHIKQINTSTFRESDRERILSAYVNEINTDLSVSKIKTISLQSYSGKLSASTNTTEGLTNVQTRLLGSHTRQVVSNYSIDTYRHPVTYKALVQYVENKSNVYHIE